MGVLDCAVRALECRDASNAACFSDTFYDDKAIGRLDVLTDVCFILDLIVNFFTAYVDDWGSLITDHKLIAQNYFSKWFWIDLPACLPFELVVPASEAIAVSMIKCVRLLRIGKILKYLDRFRFANFARIVRLFMFLMLVCHWIGCLWFSSETIGVSTTARRGQLL